jgi:hypothetical protein
MLVAGDLPIVRNAVRSAALEFSEEIMMRRMHDSLGIVLFAITLLAPLAAIGCSASGRVRVSDPDSHSHFSNVNQPHYDRNSVPANR